MNRWISLVALLGCAGCATTRGGAQFPAREELAALAEQEALAQVPPAEWRYVDRWTLTGPLPSAAQTTPHAPANAWETVLAEAAAGRPGTSLATEELHCTARELGTFALAHGGLPTRELSELISERCGATTPAVRVRQLSGTAPESVHEEELFKAWSPQLRQMLEQELAGAPRVAGLWFGRKGEQALALIVSAERAAQLQPVPFVPGEDGVVHLEGELLARFEGLRALVNQGPHGTAPCTRAEALAPPKFAFDCPTRPGDTEAVIELGGRRPGRVLGEVIAAVRVFPFGQLPFEFARTPAAAPAAGEDVTATFLSTLNGVRTEAGLAPLALAEKQSALAQRLAPGFFSLRAREGGAALADTVAVGMMAGWEVEGWITGGAFSADAVLATQGAAELVRTFLRRPFGREALMSPASGQLALGWAKDPSSTVLGALVTRYGALEPLAAEEEQRQVMVKLNAERERRGLPAANWVAPPKDAQAALDEGLRSGKLGPKGALVELLERSAPALGGGTEGWVVETGSLEELSFGDELLGRPELGVVVVVSRYKPAKVPWARYVVLFVLTPRTATPMAQRHTP